MYAQGELFPQLEQGGNQDTRPVVRGSLGRVLAGTTPLALRRVGRLAALAAAVVALAGTLRGSRLGLRRATPLALWLGLSISGFLRLPLVGWRKSLRRLAVGCRGVVPWEVAPCPAWAARRPLCLRRWMGPRQRRQPQRRESSYFCCPADDPSCA